MGAYSDWTHARTTAAMGNAKCFVQVQVRNISAKFSGCGYTYQGIQVGSIYVYLSSMLVNDVTKLDDRFLKYTVGRWISHHDARQIISVTFSL